MSGIILFDEILDKNYLFTSQQAFDFSESAISYQINYLENNTSENIFKDDIKKLEQIQKKLSKNIFEKSLTLTYKKALDKAEVPQLTIQDIIAEIENISYNLEK